MFTPDKLPRNDAEDRALYGPGHSGGGGWQMAGQMLFTPDATAPADLRAVKVNGRAADGDQVQIAHHRTSDTLTMRPSATDFSAASARASAMRPSCPVVGVGAPPATDATKAAISLA